MAIEAKVKRHPRWPSAALLVLLGACGDAARPAAPAPAVEVRAPAPWQRTEDRAPCDAFNVLRSPYFGDTHVHTTYSVDAVVFNVLATPDDAYRFARGEELRLAPYDENQQGTRPLQLRRPLDFTAVTDHSEGFGAYSVCFLPGHPGYDSPECGDLRDASVSGDLDRIRAVFFNLLAPVVVSPNPAYPESVCGPAPGEDCLQRASLVWEDIQDIGERFYDRTSACSFTSFVAYEYTANTSAPNAPLGANLHRNVIFRNAVVPDLPVSYVDRPVLQEMWRELRARCQESRPGCDWLAIPHNSNVSAGRMFLAENADGSPFTAADAALRIASEPLVELVQHKGSSECRIGYGTNDERCSFDLIQRNSLFEMTRNPTLAFEPGSFVRNAMKEGLRLEETIGVNPFQLGVVGATDTHNATPGATVEMDFAGHSGLNDDTPELRLRPGGPAACSPDDPENVQCGRGRADDSPGGLAVVWAEENSRDALFAAMRRRETYATSGTRPIVRFFAGDYPGDLCDDPDFAATGYRRGVPMGAEIGPLDGSSSPVFAVLALKDAGEPAAGGRPAVPGTPLQSVQIIKGWLDGDGEPQEKVFEVAGDPTNGAGVDLETCAPSGSGFDSLCTTWRDPEFDPRQRAFYYARILENPTCRWSTYQCNALGVDCSRPDDVPPALVACCDPHIEKAIQERAWASPIWFRPDGLGAVEGTIRFVDANADELRLEVPLGGGLAHDLAVSDLTVAVRDDGVVYEVTLPAGTLRGGLYEDESGRLAGVTRASLEQSGDGPAVLTLESRGDLSGAERIDHMVDVEVRIGDYRAAQTRLWSSSGATLATTRE